MQVPPTVAVLFLVFRHIHAIRISSSCLHGQIDASTCCIGVPTSQDVLLRNPVDCDTYFQCVHDVPLLRPCPANLHWSVAANRCEWPELAGCIGAIESTSLTEKPTREPTMKPTTPSDNNECGNIHPTLPTENCVIGQTSAEECCKGVPYWKDLLLPNPENCGSYLQCVHEKPMVRPCPEELHWSIASNRCEWPNIAQCNDNSGSSSEESGSESGESSESGGVSEGCLRGEVSAELCCMGVPYHIDVQLKNPRDCGTYLQCVHQKPMVRPCPVGLHWSVKANRCEWTNLAQCKTITV